VILADIWFDHLRYFDAELRRITEDDQLFFTRARWANWLLAPAGSGSVVAFLAAQRGAMVAMHDEEQGAGSGP